jgi:hypothetical protein
MIVLLSVLRKGTLVVVVVVAAAVAGLVLSILL